MIFQNSMLNFERTDGRTDGQAQSNMPLQLFQSWGQKNLFYMRICEFLDMHHGDGVPVP